MRLRIRGDRGAVAADDLDGHRAGFETNGLVARVANRAVLAARGVEARADLPGECLRSLEREPPLGDKTLATRCRIGTQQGRHDRDHHAADERSVHAYLWSSPIL